MEPVVTYEAQNLGYPVERLEVAIPKDVWEMITYPWPERGIRYLKREFVQYLNKKFKTKWHGDNKEKGIHAIYAEDLATPLTSDRFDFFHYSVSHYGRLDTGVIIAHVTRPQVSTVKGKLLQVYQQFVSYPEEIKKLKQKQRADVATGLATALPQGVALKVGEFAATGKIGGRRRTRKTKKSSKKSRKLRKTLGRKY
jgi:hypothetical protein